jgi:solute carrier family 25 protein 39/40
VERVGSDFVARCSVFRSVSYANQLHQGRMLIPLSSGIYWAGFESTKKYLTESQTLRPGLTMTFISGALSGTVASVLTAPFDVLKTRRQVFTPAATCSHPASTLPLLVHVMKTEGWRALFAGVIPRTAKVAPACGMMIGCYEGVGKLLGGSAGSRM